MLKRNPAHSVSIEVSLRILKLYAQFHGGSPSSVIKKTKYSSPKVVLLKLCFPGNHNK